MSVSRSLDRLFQSLDDLDRRWSARLCLKNLPASPRQVLPWQWPVVLCARLADGPVWIAIGAAAMIWGSNALRGTTIKVAVAGAFTAIVVGAIKFSVRRQRPRGAESALWSTMPRFDRYSFPSGHAARVACIATVASTADGRLALPGVLLILVVGCARVAMGIHYLLDVVCGAILGLASAYLVLLLWPLALSYANGTV